jgi:hypothetical protein
MPYEANDQWEETLNAYLEGRGLRADAEDLLMRLHLSPADRDQIERSLRLTDELTATLRQAQPSVGWHDRLLETLRACPVPAGLPQAWQANGEEMVATAVEEPPVEAELLDAAIEGRVSLDQLLAMRDAGQLSESGVEAIDAMQAAADLVARLSPASGATTPAQSDRLRTKLTAHMDSDSGVIDQRTIDRLLRQAPKQRRVTPRPDVMAAEESPEGETNE